MNEHKMASTAQKPNLITKSKVDGSKLDQPIKITGKLTSRIETRQKENQPYYYGFFKLENQAGEFPVVFKTKPALTKASQVQLLGNWAKSNGNRPSFTATQYQINKPIGKCQGLHCQKEQTELIGYCYLYNQIIDTEKGTVRPSGEKEKLEYCLDCYLYFQPMMEERMAREHQNNPALIPYQWFWFYAERDELNYSRKEAIRV